RGPRTKRVRDYVAPTTRQTVTNPMDSDPGFDCPSHWSSFHPLRVTRVARSRVRFRNFRTKSPTFVDAHDLTPDPPTSGALIAHVQPNRPRRKAIKGGIMSTTTQYGDSSRHIGDSLMLARARTSGSIGIADATRAVLRRKAESIRRL